MSVAFYVDSYNPAFFANLRFLCYNKGVFIVE